MTSSFPGIDTGFWGIKSEGNALKGPNLIEKFYVSLLTHILFRAGKVAKILFRLLLKRITDFPNNFLGNDFDDVRKVLVIS